MTMMTIRHLHLKAAEAGRKAEAAALPALPKEELPAQEEPAAAKKTMMTTNQAGLHAAGHQHLVAVRERVPLAHAIEVHRVQEVAPAPAVAAWEWMKMMIQAAAEDPAVNLETQAHQAEAISLPTVAYSIDCWEMMMMTTTQAENLREADRLLLPEVIAVAAAAPVPVVGQVPTAVC
jgi:hypothetical protein